MVITEESAGDTRKSWTRDTPQERKALLVVLPGLLGNKQDTHVHPQRLLLDRWATGGGARVKRVFGPDVSLASTGPTHANMPFSPCKITSHAVIMAYIRHSA